MVTENFVSLQKSLQYDNLGPRRVAALQKDAEEWTKRAESAVCSIQDITVNYFKETVKALAGNQNGLHQGLGDWELFYLCAEPEVWVSVQFKKEVLYSLKICLLTSLIYNLDLTCVRLMATNLCTKAMGAFNA